MTEQKPEDPKDAATPPTKAEQQESPRQDSQPAPTRKSGQGASAMGAVALLVALLAAIAAAWLWQQDREQQGQIDKLTETQAVFAGRNRELDRLAAEIKSLQATDKTLDDNFSALTKRIERQLEELPARITRLESTLDKIPGVNEQARSAWLLAEAEYFLRIANAQLNLAGDVAISLQALELADDKIKDIGDPRLTPVRAKISTERAALKSVPQPDAEGIVLELGSLAQTLKMLPLARRAPDSFTATTEKLGEPGWQRAWRAIVDALSSIISVRRNDEDIIPLMSAAEESLLLRSLEIELQIARLAVIRNDGALYREALGTTTKRIGQYFDGTALSVSNALATLETLSSAELPEALPDISGSLTLLLELGDEAATQ